MHFYAWKKGLKTGMYYLRTRAAANAIQFTVDKKLQDEAKAANKAATLVSSNATLLVPSSVPSNKGFSKPLTDISNTKPPSSVSTDGPPSSVASRSAGTLSPTTASSNKSTTEEAPLSFEEAKKRAEERELEQAQLLCSLENPGACAMCSG
jgi:ribonucleoside-diphosphate reductase subunit M1